LLKDGRWDWYRFESGLPGLNPVSLLLPGDDAIWVGFSRDGLALLEAKSVW
jgi:hypothetical protein